MKKLLFVCAITFTNSIPSTQVILTSCVLGLFGLVTLVIGPYRSETANIVEGSLGVCAALVITLGWLYETDEISQSWIVCICVTYRHD